MKFQTWRTRTAWWSGVSASSFKQLDKVFHRDFKVSWSERDSRVSTSSFSFSLSTSTRVD